MCKLICHIRGEGIPEYSLRHWCRCGRCPIWHPPGIPRGMRSVFPWHPLGIRLVYSWHGASIPVAIAPGPQRGNRSSTARKCFSSKAPARVLLCLCKLTFSFQYHLHDPISPAWSCKHTRQQLCHHIFGVIVTMCIMHDDFRSYRWHCMTIFVAIDLWRFS